MRNENGINNDTFDSRDDDAYTECMIFHFTPTNCSKTTAN